MTNVIERTTRSGITYQIVFEGECVLEEIARYAGELCEKMNDEQKASAKENIFAE